MWRKWRLRVAKCRKRDKYNGFCRYYNQGALAGCVLCSDCLQGPLILGSCQSSFDDSLTYVWLLGIGTGSTGPTLVSVNHTNWKRDHNWTEVRLPDLGRVCTRCLQDPLKTQSTVREFNHLADKLRRCFHTSKGTYMTRTDLVKCS